MIYISLLVECFSGFSHSLSIISLTNTQAYSVHVHSIIQISLNSRTALPHPHPVSSWPAQSLNPQNPLFQKSYLFFFIQVPKKATTALVPSSSSLYTHLLMLIGFLQSLLEGIRHFNQQRGYHFVHLVLKTLRSYYLLNERHVSSPLYTLTKRKENPWVHASLAFNLRLRRKSELLWNMSQKAKPNGHIYQARTDLESVF